MSAVNGDFKLVLVVWGFVGSQCSGAERPLWRWHSWESFMVSEKVVVSTSAWHIVVRGV